MNVVSGKSVRLRPCTLGWVGLCNCPPLWFQRECMLWCASVIREVASRRTKAIFRHWILHVMCAVMTGRHGRTPVQHHNCQYFRISTVACSAGAQGSIARSQPFTCLSPDLITPGRFEACICAAHVSTPDVCIYICKQIYDIYICPCGITTCKFGACLLSCTCHPRSSGTRSFCVLIFPAGLSRRCNLCAQVVAVVQHRLNQKRIQKACSAVLCWEHPLL